RDEKGMWASTGKFLSRPVVVIAGLVLVLVMNVFILLQQGATDPAMAASSNDSNVTDNEYILASSSSFEYENLDPQ
ncbi:MAG TPA: hypothetical protein VF476_07105, partial [Chitinophagaceae bacterium]